MFAALFKTFNFIQQLHHSHTIGQREKGWNENRITLSFFYCLYYHFSVIFLFKNQRAMLPLRRQILYDPSDTRLLHCATVIRFFAIVLKSRRKRNFVSRFHWDYSSRRFYRITCANQKWLHSTVLLHQLGSVQVNEARSVEPFFQEMLRRSYRIICTRAELTRCFVVAHLAAASALFGFFLWLHIKCGVKRPLNNGQRSTTCWDAGKAVAFSVLPESSFRGHVWSF